ncbi:hypothetical protein OAM29_02920 [Flavobacteriaceae bacterium]|jgi:hypothetical protein|nr:hypothetical protein [Flavobacteriaceae bacterium]|tara:strand:- start:759 stop:1652 length:894 start_codon:yes stop_codon:yes gene_type:complete
MKNIFLSIAISTVFLTVSCSSESDDFIETDPQLPKLYDFNYNLHSSLNQYYKDSIKSIIGRLEKIMPMKPYIEISTNKQVYGASVYSWKKGVTKPYESLIGDTDQCICGYINNNLVMSLQMTEDNLNGDGKFKYALLAHEFFHLYQHYNSKGLDLSHFWLIEGQAATIESLFVKENYFDSNYLKNFLNKDIILFDNAIKKVSDYEGYGEKENGDITVFMILSLSKILQTEGYSEEEAFKMIFVDFWKSSPQNSNWKTKFKEIFSLDVEEFYQKLNNYKDNPESVIPSSNLMIKKIFN